MWTGVDVSSKSQQPTDLEDIVANDAVGPWAY
jgi:hypothetical protein